MSEMPAHIAEKLARIDARKAEYNTTADWIILSISRGTRSRYYVTGINLLCDPGDAGHRFRWHVADVKNPRYAIRCEIPEGMVL